MGTADGCLAKTDKSKGMEYLIDGTDLANLPAQAKGLLIIEEGNTLQIYRHKAGLLIIEDGNALFHTIKEVPGHFRHISEILFNMLPQKVDVIFSTNV